MSTDPKLVMLTNVRLSFPHLVDPQVTQQPDGKQRVSYNADLLLDPNNPGFAAFYQAATLVANEKWKEHGPAMLNHVNQAANKKFRCWGQGNEKVSQKTFQVLDGYQGMFYITAGRDSRPQVIDQAGNPVDPQNTMVVLAELRKMYGGCRINAAVKPWAQDNAHGKAIRCDLVAVQFLRDDKPFGEGNIDASGLFGATAPGAPQAPGAAPPWGQQAPAPQAPPAAPWGAPAPQAAPPWTQQPQVAAAPAPAPWAAPQAPPAAPWGQPQAPGMPGAPFPGQ